MINIVLRRLRRQTQLKTPITYGIRFNINDGTAEAHTQEGLVYDQLQKLDANIFTREGCTFKGWSETASSPVLYTNEASVINLSAVDSTIVDLYAVWEENSEEATGSVITLNANGGIGQMAKAMATKGIGYNRRP